MTGETEKNVSGWTVDTYAVHNEALRRAEDKFQTERDRRYAEVATEREKALKIKETADLAALGLAREIQTYKDEKANQLREQINSERGNYATKDDLFAAVAKIEVTVKPLADFVTSQQAGTQALDRRREGVSLSAGLVVGAISAAAGVVVIVAFIATKLAGG